MLDKDIWRLETDQLYCGAQVCFSGLVFFFSVVDFPLGLLLFTYYETYELAQNTGMLI